MMYDQICAAIIDSSHDQELPVECVLEACRIPQAEFDRLRAHLVEKDGRGLLANDYSHLLTEGEGEDMLAWGFDLRPGFQWRDGVLVAQTLYDDDGVDCWWFWVFVGFERHCAAVEAARLAFVQNK